jgi:hypothetical protein
MTRRIVSFVVIAIVISGLSWLTLSYVGRVIDRRDSEKRYANDRSDTVKRVLELKGRYPEAITLGQAIGDRDDARYSFEIEEAVNRDSGRLFILGRVVDIAAHGEGYVAYVYPSRITRRLGRFEDLVVRVRMTISDVERFRAQIVQPPTSPNVKRRNVIIAVIVDNAVFSSIPLRITAEADLDNDGEPLAYISIERGSIGAIVADSVDFTICPVWIDEADLADAPNS